MKYKQGKHVLVKNMQKQHEQVGERQTDRNAHRTRQWEGAEGEGWGWVNITTNKKYMHKCEKPASEVTICKLTYTMLSATGWLTYTDSTSNPSTQTSHGDEESCPSPPSPLSPLPWKCRQTHGLLHSRRPPGTCDQNHTVTTNSGLT